VTGETLASSGPINEVTSWLPAVEGGQLCIRFEQERNLKTLNSIYP